MLILPIFLIFATSIGESAKILGVYNHPGVSHTFLGKVLLKKLAEKGHEVTMISSFPLEESIPNYRDINLAKNLDDLKKREKMYFNQKKQDELKTLRKMSYIHTENTFNHPEVKELLESTENFDLIIMDIFFNEATFIFGHIYKAPIILMSSYGNNVIMNPYTGNSLPFSYVPGAGMLMSDDMTLIDKLVMTALNLYMDSEVTGRLDDHNEILSKHFQNPPPVKEMFPNIALVLSNSHFSVETPRPYTPNIIPVGGFHVEKPKELPRKLQNFLDSAPNGVVYFSLGSQIKSSNLNKTTLDSIVRGLSKLPQRILWKYEAEDFEVSENVMISQWIPQIDVLAHPNVKLFITHGGLLSFIESIHYGVPFLVIPFNGDQNTNAEFVKTRELGLYQLVDDISESSFAQTITELISNSKYSKNVKYYSSLLRERPVTPMDSAIYWVEHVLKYKGAPHLRPFSLKLPLYKYYMIDVISVVLLTILAIVTILLIFVKLVWSCCKKVTRKLKRD